MDTSLAQKRKHKQKYEKAGKPKMVNIEAYMGSLILLLKDRFKQRLRYVGLQGSYLRNEADEHSDIDVMVVLDDMTVRDLDAYKEALYTNGDYQKSCGFICGKSELNSWNPLEICQLIYTTKDYYGNLKKLVPAYTLEDEKNYVKLSLNNLFHEMCHRYIHSDREANRKAFPAVFKSVFFIVQNIHYLNTGVFIPTKQELLEQVKEEHKEVLATAVKIKHDTDYDFDYTFNLLFKWCQQTIIQMGKK